MADKPKTVTVEALEWHTYEGNAYDVGDTYDVDEQLVDTLKVQGKAVPVDRVARAKAAAKAAPTPAVAKPAKPAKPAKVAKTRAAKKKK